MRVCWIDIRQAGEARDAIVEEAVHQRIDGVLAADPTDLDGLPPTVTRVLLPDGDTLPEELESVDVLLCHAGRHGDPRPVAAQRPDVEVGRFIEVVDADTLEEACQAARTDRWTVTAFRDPTKIPLEIVLAAADRAEGSLVTLVSDIEEAEVVFGVLERGSDGVLLAPSSVGEATSLKRAAQTEDTDLDLLELEVTGIRRLGMGERVCVDTCSHFGEDEGILVGSHSNGMILACSETHPLPYMPTRPFRVNAGALHSYTLRGEGRTSYLSELRSGGKVLAVDAKGQARTVVVGRAKIETRPLLGIDAAAPSGEQVNLVVQDDWHVRVLGPGAEVLNVTELTPGTKVLGCVPTEQRHVGYPIDEFCIEQ